MTKKETTKIFLSTYIRFTPNNIPRQIPLTRLYFEESIKPPKILFPMLWGQKSYYYFPIVRNLIKPEGDDISIVQIEVDLPYLVNIFSHYKTINDLENKNDKILNLGRLKKEGKQFIFDNALNQINYEYESKDQMKKQFLKTNFYNLTDLEKLLTTKDFKHLDILIVPSLFQGNPINYALFKNLSLISSAKAINLNNTEITIP